MLKKKKKYIKCSIKNRKGIKSGSERKGKESKGKEQKQRTRAMIGKNYKYGSY